jgi:L-lactate dehydrogenase complex protein LldG
MADSRTVILERIRSAVGKQTDAAADYGAIPRQYVRTGSLDAAGRMRMLEERLRDYDANVVEAEASSLPGTIVSILQGHGQKKVVAADGIADGILPEDFPLIAERAASVEDLDACDGIVTLCSVAIAFTGSIVLTHGAGEGARRLTLVPDRHLCVVRAEQIVETVPEAIDRIGARKTEPLTFISGPSATADIELTRIRGVHGPRFLDVILVR